jgi:hypothetical protein
VPSRRAAGFSPRGLTIWRDPTTERTNQSRDRQGVVFVSMEEPLPLNADRSLTVAALILACWLRLEDDDA